MKKIAFIYGSIAGLIAIANILLGLLLSGGEGAGSTVWFGYLVMLVALTMIFVGIKRYRDTAHGGVIKFGPALGLGVMIAGVAGAFYVLGWEAYLMATDYSFIHDYAQGMIEAKQAAGISGEALEKIIADTAAMVKNYDNLFYRIPMTFVEIFPVGLLVAIVSATILRNPKVLPARG